MLEHTVPLIMVTPVGQDQIGMAVVEEGTLTIVKYTVDKQGIEIDPAGMLQVYILKQSRRPIEVFYVAPVTFKYDRVFHDRQIQDPPKKRWYKRLFRRSK